MGALLMRIPSSSHPMGLRGRRIASKVPTTATGTVVPTTDSVSASGPPVPGLVREAVERYLGQVDPQRDQSQYEGQHQRRAPDRGGPEVRAHQDVSSTDRPN